MRATESWDQWKGMLNLTDLGTQDGLYQVCILSCAEAIAGPFGFRRSLATWKL
jgi:hypothetical protein